MLLTLEPLNPDDMPGYFLNDFDQAGRIVDDLGLAQVGIQFDLWHAARIHGDAAGVWAKHGPRVNHVQISGFPSRNEPGGGGFDLTGLCATLDEGGYQGWVSAEYRPCPRHGAWAGLAGGLEGAVAVDRGLIGRGPNSGPFFIVLIQQHRPVILRFC